MYNSHLDQFLHIKKWMRRKVIFEVIISLFFVLGVVYVIKEVKPKVNEIIDRVTPKGIPLHKLQFVGFLSTTAYSDRESETDSTPEITSTSKHVNRNTLAVSQDLLHNGPLSYGDIVYIEELDEFRVVDDCMNKRLTKRIDLFYFDRDKVDNFGVRKYHIYRVVN